MLHRVRQHRTAVADAMPLPLSAGRRGDPVDVEAVDRQDAADHPPPPVPDGPGYVVPDAPAPAAVTTLQNRLTPTGPGGVDMTRLVLEVPTGPNVHFSTATGSSGSPRSVPHARPLNLSSDRPGGPLQPTAV